MAQFPKPSATVFVALLRGVNVGGNNIISMKSLKTSFEQMGFTDVSTYINSGNILFKAKERDARKLETKIEAMLSREYKLGCKVVVRSFLEMASLIENLPKHWNGDSDWKYNVIFLRHSIDSEKVLESLGPKPEIEKVVYYPGTLLWSARITDFSRTTMQKLSSQKLFQDMTVRNTNTTRKLYELMKKMAEVN
ncbi:MAG TPA: DUF1697 domain-containing protein [Pyrinomonadaceae bacterium]|nr:DUF1697 domain-containing protein [Pyrinomonadaceae bacterium]